MSNGYQYRALYRTATVPPCVVTLDDLRRLYMELDAKTIEALQGHLDALQMPPDMEQATFEGLKENALREGHLTVSASGAEGEYFVARAVSSINKDWLPERLTLITFDSAAAMKVQNVFLANKFELRLDFAEPPAFISYNPWEQPTPNSSKLEVSGQNHTWVTAVYEQTMGFFRKRARRRAWLHSHVTFTALNYIVGFPAGFWIIYRLDSTVPVVAQMHTALRGGIYVYVFIICLLVFRFVVYGFRWIFPVVEIEGARSIKTRLALGAALSSILLGLLGDVIKTLL